MPDAIELYRAPSAWMARSIGPHSAEIIRLFGTDVLPTAFTPAASPADVLESIQKLNPDKRVYLRGGN